jgi:outer membrane protein assembly factor BamA
MKPAITKYLTRIPLLFLLPLVFNSTTVFSQKKYPVEYTFSGKDTLDNLHRLGLKAWFDNKEAAKKYIAGLHTTLISKGFPAASVDSVSYDSLQARVKIYLGEKYKWAQISTDSLDGNVLESIGWNENQFENKALDFQQLQSEQKKIIQYYENNGYPFAEISLQNVQIKNDKITGSLQVNKGPLYHIDSIHVYGKVKIKNLFLQHYLGIFNGDVYDDEKLQKISNRVGQLAFVQELQSWDVTMLGTGATLNLYLAPKRSSQINVLAGFVPANTITGKAQVTADVHLDLKNSFGSGENILLNWQQLQPQSPRLNLAYSIPYIFNSNFGFHFSFDLLKKDSSYLQLNGILGFQYLISANKSFDIFYQAEQDYLLAGGVDTSRVIYTKTLPPYIDVKSGNVGVGYHFVNTNYNLNPRKGMSWT